MTHPNSILAQDLRKTGAHTSETPSHKLDEVGYAGVTDSDSAFIICWVI